MRHEQPLKEHPVYADRQAELEAELERAYGYANRALVNQVRAQLDAEFPGWDDENMGS